MRCRPRACAIVLSSPNLTALAADYDHQRGCREPESEPSHDLSITRSRRREEEAHGRVISHKGARAIPARGLDLTLARQTKKEIWLGSSSKPGICARPSSRGTFGVWEN